MSKGAKVRSSGYQTGITIERSWVRILSHPTLVGNVVKAMLGQIPVPNPGSDTKKKKYIGSQMGRTKNILKKHIRDFDNVNLVMVVW